MSEYDNPIQQEAKEFGETFFSVPQALSILQSPTPRELIKTKPQRSGPDLDYVDAATVIRTLNKAFAMRWSFRIKESRVVESVPYKNNEQNPVVQTLGELTVPGLGTRTQWGSQSVVGGQQNQEHAFKGSASDALKKCAAMFLVHLDLADKGPKGHLGLTPNDIPEFDIKRHKERFAEENNTEDEDNTSSEQSTQEATSPAPEPEETRVTKTPVREATPGTDGEPMMPGDSVDDMNLDQVDIPEAVEDSFNGFPSQEEAKQAPTPAPEPKPQSQNPSANQWSKEDVDELKGHKERLNLQSNEDLNPYIQTFFGNNDMTYRHLTPQTIKDFNHYLSGQ